MSIETPKARILIVEDEVIIAADLEMHLHNLGYQVCGNVTDGVNALERTEKNKT